MGRDIIALNPARGLIAWKILFRTVHCHTIYYNTVGYGMCTVDTVGYAAEIEGLFSQYLIVWWGVPGRHNGTSKIKELGDGEKKKRKKRELHSILRSPKNKR